MTRTTRTEVEAVFARLCAAVGVPCGSTYDSESGSFSRGWSLDHAACYGGWTVAGHSGDGTGEDRPLGDRRMPAGEFVAAMHFAIRAVEAKVYLDFGGVNVWAFTGEDGATVVQVDTVEEPQDMDLRVNVNDGVAWEA